MTEIPIQPANSKYNPEQWQAIHQQEGNILVSASAGSGKTTVLVERIMQHILNQRAWVDELLVVTFTEIAAREMKERIESQLKNQVNQHSNPELQQRFIQEINKLADANIQTLHSFCLEVISQYFYLNDLDPGFDLLTDESQKALIYQQVWQQLCQEIEEGKAGIDSTNFENLLYRYSSAKSDQGLFDLVIEIYQFAMAHPEPQVWLRQLPWIHRDFAHFEESDLFQNSLSRRITGSLITVLKLNQEAIDASQRLSQEHAPKYLAALTEDQAHIIELKDVFQEQPLSDFMTLLDSFSCSNWPRNSKKYEDYEHIEALKAQRDQYKKILERNVQSLFDLSYETYAEVEQRLAYDLTQLSQLIQDFYRLLQSYKQDHQLMDYNDLEHYSLDILAPYQEDKGRRVESVACQYYRQKFKEVLVDEYQDINETQATILSFLSQADQAASPGNQFLVGDVKQSIYGFRMAEPTLFLNKYQQFAQDPDNHLIHLDRNYRSRHEVLQFINFIFERLMDQEFGQMNYGQQESLKTGNHSFVPQAPDAKFNVEFLLYESQAEEREDDEEGFDQSIEAECHILAQKIKDLVDSSFQIYDKDIETLRPIEYRDIVILSATRSPFLKVQEVFKQYQIPLYSQKIESYFQRHEIQIVLALLKIIDNPRQDIPLVAVLRSFFAGFSDEELAQIRIPHKEGDYYQALIQFQTSQSQWDPEKVSQLQLKIQRFLKQLHTWQDLAQNVSLVELIWQIYLDSNFLNYVAALDHSEQRLANLHGFYQHAKEFEQRSYLGLKGFINYINQMIESDHDIAEPLILEADQNFVRIMTVHASKGLEFPVLFLLNTGKGFNLQDLRGKYISSKEYGVSSYYFDDQQLLKFDSLTRKALAILAEGDLKAEEMRKLYVALTRCEQKLYIIGSVKNQEQWQANYQKSQQLHSGGLLVNQFLRQTSRSWLEWLNYAIAIPRQDSSTADFQQSQIEVHFYQDGTITSAVEQESVNHQQRQRQERIIDFLRQDLPPQVESNSWETLWQIDYPYPLASRTSSYQSVSELKRFFEEPSNDKLDTYSDRRPFSIQQLKQAPAEDKGIQGIRYTEDSFAQPQFMGQAEELAATEVGSLTHLFLQHLSLSAFANQDRENYASILSTCSQSLVHQGLLSNQHLKQINIDAILWFLQTELGQEFIAMADLVRREQAFSYLIPAKQVFASQEHEFDLSQLQEDDLLIHGVIDAYYPQDHSLILIDYKTDRYHPQSSRTKHEQLEQIYQRYKFQMQIYSQALKEIYGHKEVKANLILLDFKEIVTILF